MRMLSASKLLSVWEQVLGQPQVERALALLCAACPELTPLELARASIGRRDTLLLALREQTFGPQLVSRVNCQQCGEALALSFNVSDVLIPQEALPEDALHLSLEHYEVHFRLPNSEDLMRVTGAHDDVETASQLLLARCVLRAVEDGEQRPVDELPLHVRQAVVRRMAEADPQALVQLALSCPACSHRWLVTFDIASYFWSEINAWAYRILREVHTLATAYGWREADILAMSSRRRQVYLEMVSG
jgi:hypothetical protein